MSYYLSSPPRPPERKVRSVGREIGLIALVLFVAAGAVVGGYLLANHSGGIFAKVFPFGQPTPVPSLAPMDAFNQIHTIMPAASVSVTQPLQDEVDLITTTTTQPLSTLTPQQQTQILSLYMRGYPKQTFWRWRDEYQSSSNLVLYEVHPTELWVITLHTTTCSQTWTVWPIIPTDIIDRGASGGDYTAGITSHPGTGPLPDGLANC